jgi:hypothetical protein
MNIQANDNFNFAYDLVHNQRELIKINFLFAYKDMENEFYVKNNYLKRIY